MTELLSFCERHPVWSFFALLVVAHTLCTAFVSLAAAVRGRS